MTDDQWCPENDAAYRAELAAANHHTTQEQNHRLRRALIASEAARNMAEERLAKVEEALRELADEYADPTNESEGPAYRTARAILMEIDNG